MINPDVNVRAIVKRIDETNEAEILAGAQVLVDATDRIQTRLMLQEIAENRNIPMVHGAIAGWFGQVMTIMPGDKTLDTIYPKGGNDQGVEKLLGNPSFTPSLVGSIQVSEVVKLLIGRGEPLRNKMLYIDLFEQEYTILEMA